MLNLEVRTRLKEKEVLENAKKFFGAGGLGLEVREDGPECLTFQGGGGYASVSVCREEDKTRVSLITQEWEIQVRNFAATLP